MKNENAEVLKVHPVAALFPMMSDEELKELAADIKANGLIHPIILDNEGMLIDGRNRLEACKRANVKPTFGRLSGGMDPVAFILSTNITRRHLNQGQRAILIGRLDSNQNQRALSKDSKVSQSYIAQARVILEHAPDLADAIIFSGGKFDPAYQEAKRRKEEKARHEAKIKTLQEAGDEGAELWAKVQDENDPLTLDGAIQTLQDRIRERERTEEEAYKIAEQERKLSTEHLENVINLIDPGNRTEKEKANHFLELYDRRYSELEITREILISCSNVIKHLSEKWTNNGEKNSSK